MSDGKRRRFRKNKQDDQRPVILAKRNVDEDSGPKKSEAPKILLKTRNEREVMKEDSEATTSSDAAGIQAPLKTIIVTRSEAAQSPALSGSSPKEHITVETATQIAEPVPQMTRPATVISSTGLINTSARKLFQKENTDFLVVGVIGAQGVGKSTIMNLLANDKPNYDYYAKVFAEEDSIFPTKLKPHKSARSRTESTHMFITTDRMILLDSPPVLCNSYKKDMTTNELDDLHNIIGYLSVCHLLIVVQDDYFNMNFIRLLQLAELMKPTQDNKPFANDYFPNLLFVKNRAKRYDYIPGQKERLDKMLKTFFKDSQLRIYLGQTAEQQQLRQRKGRQIEADHVINSVLFPEIKGPDATTFHQPLHDIVDELRALIFMTPRNEMYTGSSEFTEVTWFELLTKVSQESQHFFFNTYEEIQRKHLEISNSNNAKDSHENWRE